MKKKHIFFTLFLIFFLLFFLSTTVFAADPKLIAKMNTAFNKVKSWLIKLSTPAAAIAIASGSFMKKFSFGDEERMRVGKKLIRTTVFSYVFVLLLDLILTTIQNLLSD